MHFDDFHDFGGRYHEALDFFIEFSFLSRAQRGLRQPNAEKTMDDRTWLLRPIPSSARGGPRQKSRNSNGF